MFKRIGYSMDQYPKTWTVFLVGIFVICIVINETRKQPLKNQNNVLQNTKNQHDR